MASVIREPNGRKTIPFVSPNGKRPKIRLGKVSFRQAESVKRSLLMRRRLALSLIIPPYGAIMEPS